MSPWPNRYTSFVAIVFDMPILVSGKNYFYRGCSFREDLGTERKPTACVIRAPHYGTAMKRLVIVESPKKARTITRFLPDNYVVEASVGHIRDLPMRPSDIPKRYRNSPLAKLGLRENNGEIVPIYVVPPDKHAVLKSLRAALRDVDELLIATDEDREGEAIGWHLVDELKPTVPVRRMVFHEITRPAINAALNATRAIDMNKVRAQEARRILDRLVGWRVSPVLWRKIAPKLSAGRVQSVAVRLLVEREKERLAFVAGHYWGLTAMLDARAGTFEATLTRLGEGRLATGRDFDDDTGALKRGRESRGTFILKEEQARALAEALPGSPLSVASIQSKEKKRRPAPPFITSSLQQEASRKLRWRAKKTMQVAQGLYERGFITYMRTDSVTLSKEAIEATRRTVAERYGNDFLYPTVRTYSGKAAGAQEAHEAIRPAGTAMQSAKEHGLAGEDARLYDLIWRRTLASQMADARVQDTTVTIEAHPPGHPKATLRATGREVLFPGFLLAYVEGSDDAVSARKPTERPLPVLAEGEALRCMETSCKSHETKPPARHTDASLIKKLEQEGIGRPSTYATILDTIQNRGAAVRKGQNALRPTFTAFAITNLMEKWFATLVDLKFTASMELELDAIAQGRRDRAGFLRDFDDSDSGLMQLVDAALKSADPIKVSTIHSPRWEDFEIRVGRYGPYALLPSTDAEPKRVPLPKDWLPEDVTKEKLLQLPQQRELAQEPLGIHPENGREITLKRGRFGWYVELAAPKDSKAKPRSASLPKGREPKDMTLEEAIELLRFPRLLGKHPDSNASVTVHAGRYGPYVKCDKSNASLTSADNASTVTLERALELLAKKSAPSGKVKELGKGPDNQPIELFKGRYGHYVKYGGQNASIPKGEDVDLISPERALALLTKRSAAAGLIKSLGHGPGGESVDLMNGRYGPYIKHAGKNASLPKDMDPAALTLEEALELIRVKGRKPGTRRRRRSR